jgi:hypothetical protein
MTARRAIVLGTLTVGTLDILDAITFFGIRNHVAPIRIFQSIAAGVLGRASFDGGLKTAILGGLLHYFVAFCVVLVYYAGSRALRVLRQRPVVCGALYGIGVYLVMNLAVLPLSNAGPQHFVPAVVVNGMLIHIFGVGLPSAFAAGAAR